MNGHLKRKTQFFAIVLVILAIGGIVATMLYEIGRPLAAWVHERNPHLVREWRDAEPTIRRFPI
jgi:hypothetical protein